MGYTRVENWSSRTRKACVIRTSWGPLQKEVVEHLVQAEERLGVRVPLIPVGLEYDSYARPGARVYFRVDEPLYADSFANINELMDHLGNRLRVLSGLA